MKTIQQLMASLWTPLANARGALTIPAFWSTKGPVEVTFPAASFTFADQSGVTATADTVVPCRWFRLMVLIKNVTVVAGTSPNSIFYLEAASNAAFTASITELASLVFAANSLTSNSVSQCGTTPWSAAPWVPGLEFVRCRPDWAAGVSPVVGSGYDARIDAVP